MHDASLDSEVNFERMLREAKAGSTSARTTLLEYFRPLLSRLAHGLVSPTLRPKCSSADLVQDSLMAAHHSFEQFHGICLAELRHWLVAILQNSYGTAVRTYCTCRKRQLAREVSLDDPVSERRLHLKQQLVDPSPQPIDIVLRRENDEHIQAAVGVLPQQYRTIIQARLWEKMTFAAIANELGCSADWASDLYVAAVRQVARILAEQGALE